MIIKADKLLLATLLFLSACSGGGGGSDSSGNDDDGIIRGHATGIKLVHAVIDETPLALVRDGIVLKQLAFAESKGYVEVPEGPAGFALTRANAPAEIIKLLNYDLQKDTEYSLFLFGSAQEGSVRLTLLTDNVSRPAEGKCLVRVINGLVSSGKVSVKSEKYSIGNVPFGSASSFVEGSCGLNNFVFDSFGEVISSMTLSLEDQSEITLLVTGTRDLDEVLVRPLVDLD